MLRIISVAPTSGRVASQARQFISHVLGDKQNWELGQEPVSGDITVFLRPVSKQIAAKMRDPNATGKVGAAKSLWSSLKPPGRFADCYGTFWRSETTGALVVGIPHPCGVPWAWRALLVWWLKLAFKMSKSNHPESLLFTWNWEENPPFDRLFQESGLCSFDIETNGFSGGITHFGFADSLGACSWEWTLHTQAAIREWLSTSRAKVAQNYVFDVPRLEKECGVSLTGPLHDTMAMRSVYTRQWPYGLQYLMSQFHCVDPWKTSFKEGKSSDMEYNAKDAQATLAIAHRLVELVPSLESAGLRC